MCISWQSRSVRDNYDVHVAITGSMWRVLRGLYMWHLLEGCRVHRVKSLLMSAELHDVINNCSHTITYNIYLPGLN